MKLTELITAALALKRLSAEYGFDLDPDVLIDGNERPVAVREVDYGIGVTDGRVVGHLMLTPERQD